MGKLYISRAEFISCAWTIVRGCQQDSEEAEDHGLADFFGFVDDEILENLYSQVERCLYSGYSEEKWNSLEHGIAYVAVTVILNHSLIDGNKRSGILAMLTLLSYENLTSIPTNSISPTQLYRIANSIAADGNAKREESINILANLIRETWLMKQ